MDGNRTVGAVRGHVDHVRRHFNRTGHLAHFQTDLVQVDTFVRRHGDPFDVLHLEARVRGAQAIGSRHQAGKNETAHSFSCELPGGSRLIVGQSDRSAGNHCSGRVHHNSRNLASDALAMGCRQHSQQGKHYP